MRRYRVLATFGAFAALLVGCSRQPQKPKVDPVTQTMLQTVAGSAAKVTVLVPD